MSQTSYSQTHPASFAGMKADAGFGYVESKPALGSIDFGYGVVNGNARANSAKTPKRNTATNAGDVDLVASNVVNGKVNGVTLTATTYATSHAATMAVIAAKIDAALLTLGIVAVTTVVGNDFVTVAQDANVLFTDWVVTAGAGQTVFTASYTTADFFRGVALHTHKEPRTDLTVGYADKDTVSIMRKGRVWVKVNEAVVENDTAYCVLATATEEGLFCKTSTGNIATGGKFITGAADNGLAVLEINLP